MASLYRLFATKADILRAVLETALGKRTPRLGRARSEHPPCGPVYRAGHESFAFDAQIADSSRRHSCFLVGDAAHRMTASGGTGMPSQLVRASFLMSVRLSPI
jgi:2-polyprenyl-6-methoxyphenol hydroxylase-like FAD-dependent oxidoreductase